MRWKIEKRRAYELLADMAREAWGFRILPDIARLDNGKPWFPGHSACYFNVSHSGIWSMCGVSAYPVGVDIEQIRPRRPGLARYVLNDTEFAWFRAHGSRWEDFYTLWTLKESRVKCTGEGLRQPARSIRVPLLAAGEARQQEGFFFTSLAGEGWRAAICERRLEKNAAKNREET